MAERVSSGIRKKRRFVFQGYFSVLLSLTIVAAALLWVISTTVSPQYYLPASLGVVVLIGVAGFFILNKKIEI